MFSARRKPKRVARDDSDRDANNDSTEAETSNLEESSPVVRRPTAAPKSRSKLRTSFAPDEAEENNTSDAPAVIRPKQRLGGQKSTSTQALPRFNIDSPRTQDLDNALRPSYSKSALEELRNSTPSTPKDLSVHDPSSGAEDVTAVTVDSGTSKQDLDLLSKFGSQSLKPASSIPSATEIAEKKARRARLAKEQDAYKTDENYIALDDDQLYDSDGEFKPRRMQVGTYLHTNHSAEKDTRMIRDDEDIMEGFDEYTEDAQSNRITMGRKQLLQAQRQDREAMRSMIDSAQGHHHHHHHHHHQNSEPDSDSDSNSSDSDERNHLYEKSQTNHGMDGLSSLNQSHRLQQQTRPRQPREMTPIPKLATTLDKLRERVAGIEISRVQIERRRAEIRRERAEVRESQEHIQKSLVEAGEELDGIRKRLQQQQQQQQERDQEQEVERRGGGGVNGNDEGGLRASGGVAVERGLDSMGVTPEPA